MTERETVHYGPVGQCRTHTMEQGCEGRRDDCRVELIATELPEVGYFDAEDSRQ